MPVSMSSSAQHRLNWVMSQYEAARDVRVVTTYNWNTNMEKIAFRFDSRYHKVQSPRIMLEGIFVAIKDAITRSVVVDKGHSASNGVSIVEFWIGKSFDMEHSADMPPVPPPVSVMRADAPDFVPPVSPPPIETLDANSVGLEEISNRLQNLEIMSAHTNTNTHLLYSMQDKLDKIQQRCSVQVADVGVAVPSRVSGFSVDVGLQSPDRMDRAPIDRVDVGVQAPIVGMKRYSFHRIDAASKPSVLTSDATTQVNAMMIHDWLEDTAIGYYEITHMPEEEHGESENDEEFLCDPEVESSESEEEEYEPLPASIKQTSSFWHKRVYDSCSHQKGTVIDILKGVNSKVVMYVVRYDNGDCDNRLLREEIKELAAAYENLKDRRTAGKDKASSSRTRHR